MIGSGFRIGRLYGITIRVDWSWLIIALLVTWNLTNIFRQLHPDWSPALSLGLAMLASLLFFASVLAHELAHSVVARSFGLPVRNITLFLFGGVANIQREPPSPKAEFWIAIAGPAMSLLVGVALFAAGLGGAAVNSTMLNPGRIAAGLSPASTILLWLGSINIILAVFNMVPGFPLDGGRVLRAVLWAVTGSMHKATRLASWAGRLIAWIMITTGVMMIFGVRVPFFGTGMLNGIWLIFIGWFLNNASVQSYRQVVIQEMLQGVTVERMMQRDPITAEPGSSVAELVSGKMMGTDENAFPVLEDGRLVGMLTLDDVRRIPRETWNRTTVREAMTPGSRLVTVTPEEGANDAVEKLAQRAGATGDLPVITGNGELVGLLRQRDIIRWLQLHSGGPGRSRTYPG